MAKASIHFRPAKGNSESHNEREVKLDYVHENLTENNESWSKSSITEKYKEIQEHAISTNGKKLYKNATPIREAVINLNSNHNIDDLKKLSDRLEKEKGIKCFQIHIHKDEGKSKEEINHHAHMVFDWQDKETGKMIRLNKMDMSQIQTIVADELGMERGELKENTNRERLEAVEYKAQQEAQRLEQMRQDIAEMEAEKKNLSLKNNQHEANIKRWRDEKKKLQNKIANERKKPQTSLLTTFLKKAISGLKQLPKQLKEELVKLKTEFLDIKKEFETYFETYKKDEKELSNLEKSIKELKADTAKLEKNMPSLKAEHISTSEKLIESKSELQTLEQQLNITKEENKSQNKGRGMGMSM